VSLEELTKATRIATRFLNALENEEWEKLPGGVFGRGFVRTIGRYLGLDEGSFLAEYDLARGEQKPEGSAPYESQIPRPPKWIPVAAVLGLLLVVVGLFFAGRYGLRRYLAHRAAKQSSSISNLLSPSSSEPAVASAMSAQTPAPVNGATASLDLSVSTSATTHVKIVADGKLLLDADVAAGENRHFIAAQQFEVSAADSSAVLLELNGKAMPPLGAPGASGTMMLSEKDLRPAGGTSQP
jgi:cytoskeletal protein RodZ